MAVWCRRCTPVRNDGVVTAGAEPTTVRYRDLFRDREFAGMWLADVLSMAGSYLARLAVAALVYHRTASPGLTAVAFAGDAADGTGGLGQGVDLPARRARPGPLGHVR